MNFTATLETMAASVVTASTAAYLPSTTTTEIPPDDCPIYAKSDDAIIDMFSFW